MHPRRCYVCMYVYIFYAKPICIIYYVCRGALASWMKWSWYHAIHTSGLFVQQNPFIVSFKHHHTKHIRYMSRVTSAKRW